MDPVRVRESLFADMALEACASVRSNSEPWMSFRRAWACVKQDDPGGASRALSAITLADKVESRYRLQACHSLRQLGQAPPGAIERDVFGLVVEVGMAGGLDLVAAYVDGTAHYYNYSGSGVVWMHADASLDELIHPLLAAARSVVPRIGPWKGTRRPPPATDHVRLNILTPLGLHFGEGPFDLLDRDPLGRPILQAATSLMRRLTSLPRSGRQSSRLDS